MGADIKHWFLLFVSTISLSDLQNIARYSAENTIYQQKLSAPKINFAVINFC